MGCHQHLTVQKLSGRGTQYDYGRTDTQYLSLTDLRFTSFHPSQGSWTVPKEQYECGKHSERHLGFIFYYIKIFSLPVFYSCPSLEVRGSGMTSSLPEGTLMVSYGGAWPHLLLGPLKHQWPGLFHRTPRLNSKCLQNICSHQCQEKFSARN